jgi:AcrR family transcriptional regulator
VEVAMTAKSTEKRKYILSCAEQVFIRYGFNRVTMKNIIEECKISRGGIYLYFSSVDEIFVEVVKRHNKEKIDNIKISIEKSQNFDQLIDDFFTDQKEHLLNMDRSLFAAMIEFCFSHKNNCDRDFYTEQFFNTKVIILEMLKFGQKSHAITAKNTDSLADSIMYMIEGLRSLAVSSGVSDKLAENQLRVCKKMIYSDLF